MKIPKSEAEYNMKSLRFLLLTITTMFIFVSILMIVLGISVYSRYHDFSFLYESAKNGKFLAPSILVVVLGVAMLVVTSLGFFGSLKGSTCMVNMYALALFLTLIVELAVVIVAFTMDPARIIEYINIPVEYYSTDREVEMEIDFLQRSLKCCGSTSYLDYIGQEFNESHNTVKVIYEYESIAVPATCCNEENFGYCTKLRNNNCTSAIVNMFIQNASVLGVLGISVLFIQLLGIIFALLLARSIRKMKSERGLRKWKDSERMIREREARVVREAAKDGPRVFWVDGAGSTEA